MLPRVGRPQLRFNRWHMGRHASLHVMTLTPLLALVCASCSDESSASNGVSEKQISDEDGTQSSAAERMIETGLNMLATPYSIRVVVRQGDREWRKSMERLDREDWPDTPPMPRDRTEFAIRAGMDSIGVDVSELLKGSDYGG